MEVERLISIFDKRTEKIIKEVNIDSISSLILKDIFSSREGDPDLYDPYSIDNFQLRELNNYLDPKIEYDDRYIYQLDCFKIPKPR